jgi:hypothetical protein
MTLFYKAIFPGRIETRSTQTRTYVACLVVTWATERGAGGYVTWCGTYARASAEAERELAVHLVNASRRVPKTAIGRLGHLIIGIVLGAVVAAVVIVWMTGAPRWPSSPA